MLRKEPAEPTLCLACATEQEAEPLFKAFGRPSDFPTTENDGRTFRWEIKDCHLLLTVCGIGAANTALHLARCLTGLSWGSEALIQFGIAGAYDPDILLAKEVYEVVEDAYADLGAHTPDGFRDLEQLGFVNFEYFKHGPSTEEPLCIRHYNRLVNPRPSPLAIPKVKGLTVQAVSGDEASISRMLRYAPDATLESMEGAAFFQVGLSFSERRFYQFRAVSNHVEPRAPSRWKIKPAIDRMGEFIVELLRQQPDWLFHDAQGSI